MQIKRRHNTPRLDADALCNVVVQVGPLHFRIEIIGTGGKQLDNRLGLVGELGIKLYAGTGKGIMAPLITGAIDVAAVVTQGGVRLGTAHAGGEESVDTQPLGLCQAAFNLLLFQLFKPLLVITQRLLHVAFSSNRP